MSDELDEKLAELAILQQSLEDQKAKAAEYYDQLLRLRAALPVGCDACSNLWMSL